MIQLRNIKPIKLLRAKLEKLKIETYGLILNGEYKDWYIFIQDLQDDEVNTGGYLILLKASLDRSIAKGYDHWVETEEDLYHYFDSDRMKVDWQPMLNETMRESDERQYKLMAAKIKLFRENKIQLSSLINDLGCSLKLLKQKDSSWLINFGDYWKDLEKVYSKALKEDREIFSNKEMQIINKALEELNKLIQANLKRNLLYFLVENIKDSNLQTYFQSVLDQKRLNMNDYLTDKYLMDLSSSDREKLLKELTCLLVSKGTNSDGSINTQGTIIEELIDLLKQIKLVFYE